jgi:hypothetical protein
VPGSFGFAYGTLLGRPERGEESFHVRLDDQGVVSFHVVAFSRPGDLATELALGRSPAIRSTATRRCIRGIKRYVGERGQCTIRERVKCRYGCSRAEPVAGSRPSVMRSGALSHSPGFAYRRRKGCPEVSPV